MLIERGGKPPRPRIDDTYSPRLKTRDEAGRELMASSRAAFEAALPDLLKEKPGEWVAFHNREKIAGPVPKLESLVEVVKATRSGVETCFAARIKPLEKRTKDDIGELNLRSGNLSTIYWKEFFPIE